MTLIQSLQPVIVIDACALVVVADHLQHHHILCDVFVFVICSLWRAGLTDETVETLASVLQSLPTLK